MNILKLLTGFKNKSRLPVRSPGRTEIMISGIGGQGVITAGKILAEAASIYDGKEALMSQSYGPEARGGAARAEVIISADKILYPKAMHTGILLCLSQQSLDKYGSLLKPGGLLIVNETMVENIPPIFKHVFKAPFSALAVKLFDNLLVTNIIALGALTAVTGIVSREALIHAVLDMVPDKTLVIDRVAVDAGFKAVSDRGFKWDAALQNGNDV